MYCTRENFAKPSLATFLLHKNLNLPMTAGGEISKKNFLVKMSTYSYTVHVHAISLT